MSEEKQNKSVSHTVSGIITSLILLPILFVGTCMPAGFVVLIVSEKHGDKAFWTGVIIYIIFFIWLAQKVLLKIFNKKRGQSL